MKKRSLFVLLLLVLIGVALVFITYYIRTEAVRESQDVAKNTIFSQDAEAKFVDTANNSVSLEQYQDQIVVVNVWASWSPYTTIEFPIFDEVASRYSERGVRFLMVNRKEPQPQIERFLATIPTYSNLELIVDVNDFFYTAASGYAMPETVIYDADGKIITHLRGVIDKGVLESTLDSILSEAE